MKAAWLTVVAVGAGGCAGRRAAGPEPVHPVIREGPQEWRENPDGTCSLTIQAADVPVVPMQEGWTTYEYAGQARLPCPGSTVTAVRSLRARWGCDGGRQPSTAEAILAQTYVDDFGRLWAAVRLDEEALCEHLRVERYGSPPAETWTCPIHERLPWQFPRCYRGRPL